LYNRTHTKTAKTIKEGNSDSMVGHESILNMINKMESPRTIITMLPHGSVNFENIKHTSNLLSSSDTIIDCANEHYKQSLANSNVCVKNQVNYLGVGMSGGSNGALNGPAIMVGGPRHIYEKHEDFLKSFCTNVVYLNNNPDSGHFTKMVHNGIEYSMLQIFADIYGYLNKNEESMKVLLEKINKNHSELYGYLGICAKNVLNMYDLPNISDKAQMNDTGLWCVQYAYENKLNASTMHSAVLTRISSNMEKNNESVNINEYYLYDYAISSAYVVFAMSIIEGLTLIRHKKINENDAINSWNKSTIIECDLLNYDKCDLYTLIEKHIVKARLMYIDCVKSKIPCPSLGAAIEYYDMTHQKQTQMNFLIAQRNYFGQHEIKTD
jgi:6-phosphogluconate dehydrogenase